ncbi:MAG: hypothetical protein SFY80_08275 [Verrucomicrobiota bacterium]|nr:hypothetical protein [Verrucomicrobiota bacterium]
MKSLKIWLLLTLILGGTLFSGCETKTDKDSTIPWSQPASWEGSVPGMPGSPR